MLNKDNALFGLSCMSFPDTLLPRSFPLGPFYLPVWFTFFLALCVILYSGVSCPLILFKIGIMFSHFTNQK